MNSSKSEDISPHSVVASCTVNSGDTNQTDSNKTKQQQQVNNNSNNDLLPIEYQLYEVDLTHPDIDPLEYTFRKYVPIPKESPRLVLVCCVKNVVSVTLYSYSNKVQLTCTNIICLPPFHLHKSLQRASSRYIFGRVRTKRMTTINLYQRALRLGIIQFTTSMLC